MTEERLALLERAQQGDDEACRQMLTENAGLIWSIVKRYHHCGVEMDDLYQLGCIGFIKAVKGFDLTYGTQFSTYAVPKIAGEIRRFLRDDGPIKVGRTLREKGQMLWAARERLQNRLSCAPKLSELAEETGLTVEEIASIELAVVPPESLQQETVEGMTLESVLGTEEPETGMVERIALREAIDQLPEQERKAILLRFFKGLTQEQTAACFMSRRYRSHAWNAAVSNGYENCWMTEPPLCGSSRWRIVPQTPRPRLPCPPHVPASRIRALCPRFCIPHTSPRQCHKAPPSFLRVL